MKIMSIFESQHHSLSVIVSFPFSWEDVVKSAFTQPYIFFHNVFLLNLLSSTYCHFHLTLVCRAKFYSQNITFTSRVLSLFLLTYLHWVSRVYHACEFVILVSRKNKSVYGEFYLYSPVIFQVMIVL